MATSSPTDHHRRAQQTSRRRFWFVCVGLVALLTGLTTFALLRSNTVPTKPIGAINHIDCAGTVASTPGVYPQTGIFGWAKDPGDPDAAIRINIFVDDVRKTVLVADKARVDVGDHAWSWTLPAELRDGKAHRITAFADSATGGPVFELPFNASDTRNGTNPVTCTADAAATPVTVAPTVATPTVVTTAAPAASPSAVGQASSPMGFSAQTSVNNGIVSLTWSGPESGVQGYKLERSLDGTAWQALGSGMIPTTSYQDLTAAFGVRYFYRLSSVDPAGALSAPVTADAFTPPFLANNAGTGVTLTSSDDRATAVLAPGSLGNNQASCTLLQRSPATGQQDKPVAGMYQVICKDATGTPVTTFSEPVSWVIGLSEVSAGGTPVALATTVDGVRLTADASTYDPKIKSVSFSADGNALVGVEKGKASILPAVLIGGGLLLLLALAALAILLLPKRQAFDYDDYIRKKYYDL